jgi:hypothetical protein
MASLGSMIFATLSWLPSIPYTLQVEGRNCIGPRAPALEGPMFCPWFDSTSPTAASMYQSLPKPYFLAAFLYRWRYSLGGSLGTGYAAICPRAICICRAKPCGATLVAGGAENRPALACARSWASRCSSRRCRALARALSLRLAGAAEGSGALSVRPAAV